MMLLVIILYIVFCVFIHCAALVMHKNSIISTYSCPKSKCMYYLLSFTWGLPMNLLGAIFALVMLCIGKKPKKHGWNYYFELDVDFGLELGVFFIAPKNASEHLKNHELGHSLQNIYYGIFTVGVISIPSAVRFWVRKIQSKKGKQLPPYDSIWFEGSATSSGTAFMKAFNK